MNLEVGDKVRVKSQKWYDSCEKDFAGGINIGCYFAVEMVEYLGEIVTISKTWKTDSDECRYEILEDSGVWEWCEEFFEQYHDET